MFSGFMIGVSPCLEEEVNRIALNDETVSQLDSSSQLEQNNSFNSSNDSRFGTIRNASVLSPIHNRTRVFDSVKRSR